jgi:ammonia channel protein AmtB
MIPGLGFFYSGLLRRKNALSMIFTSMASIAVVSFQVRLLSLHPQKHAKFSYPVVCFASGFSGVTP